MVHSENELRAAYDRDGYVVVRRLFSRAEVLTLRTHAESLVAHDHEGEPLRFVQTAYDRKGAVKLIKASGLADHDRQFNAFATRDSLVDVVETLLGRGARRFRDVLIVKPGCTGASFSYHQDSAYWDVEPQTLVSAWISLGDVSEDGSCLRIVPGTHQHPIEHQLYLRGRHRVPPSVTRMFRRLVSLAGTGDNPEGAGGNVLAWKAKRWILTEITRYVPVVSELQDFRIPPTAVEPGSEVLLPVQAGDVVFFHSLLWHASGPNRTDIPRFAEIISFMGPHTRFVGRGPGTFPRARRH